MIKLDQQKIICEIFGLSRNFKMDSLQFNTADVPSNGLIYITGASGSGKSTLLRQLFIENPEMKTLKPEADLVNNQNPISSYFYLEVGPLIRWLSKFGLGEPRVMLLPYKLLSDGQKFRFRLALLLHSNPSEIAIDEFLSVVDRKTASLVAWHFQKILRTIGVKRAVVVTGNTDLIEPLIPDHVINVNFNSRFQIDQPQKSDAPFWKNDIKIETGNWDDYLNLSQFHYIDEKKEAIHDSLNLHFLKNTQIEIVKVTYQGQLAGISVFCKPFPTSFEKIELISELNRSVVIRARTIIHPVFRGLGLTSLLKPTTENQKKTIVSSSALGQYFPFQLNGGFDFFTHPSIERTKFHVDLENTLGLEIEVVNGISIIKKRPTEFEISSFFNNLELGSMALNAALQIHIDLNMNLLHSYANLSGITTPVEEDKKIQYFFKLIFQNLIKRNPVKMVHEALYFPMQGFVLNKFKETNNGVN